MNIHEKINYRSWLHPASENYLRIEVLPKKLIRISKSLYKDQPLYVSGHCTAYKKQRNFKWKF